MPDVFISYSRKDKLFAQKLHDALVDNGRDVWIDYEGIPLSADWWAEIEAAIQGSNAFVFIISPDSTTSEVCAKEIGCAVVNNKRMIPLLHREVDAKTVPPEVASLNWIFMRESDNFTAAVDSLIATMDTDLERVKAHTRLTQRATEWDRKGRNDSFLLRGDDLAEAERRFMQTGKEPPLTDLQAQYIWTSRRSADRRQRLIVGAVSFGLVVAIILGLIAFFNFLRATAAEQEAIASAATAWKAVDIADQAQATAVADRNRAATAEALAYLVRDEALADQAQAISRQLAAEALANLQTDPQLSALLAMQGLATAHTPEAEQALRQALESAQVGYNASLNNLDPEELQIWAQDRITRQLTEAECQKYLRQNNCS